MEKRSALYALVVFGSLLALCFVFLYFLFSALEQKGEQGWGNGAGPKIGVVELTGTISDSKDVIGQLHELPYTPCSNITIGSICVWRVSAGTYTQISPRPFRLGVFTVINLRLLCSNCGSETPIVLNFDISN